jgi:hypothetical protein
LTNKINKYIKIRDNELRKVLSLAQSERHQPSPEQS